MNKRFIIFFLINFFCLTSCIVIKSSKVEKVVSMGIAPITSNNLTYAKNVAIADALKEALHKTLGVYISQDIEISKSILLDENILSNTNGYIEKYEILKEKIENDFYKVKVKSKVKKGTFLPKIKDYNYKKIGNPKIFISIKEYVDDAILNKNIAKNLISSYFLEKKAIVLEKNENFDVLVLGNIKTSFNFDIKGLISYLARLELKVLNNKTNEIIKIYNLESKGVGINKDEASKNSIEKCTAQILEAIYTDIYDYFDKNVLIEVFIDGNINIDDLINMKKIVQTFVNVREVKIENFENKSGQLSVYCKNADVENFLKNLSVLNNYVVKKLDFFRIYLEKVEKK